MPQMRRKPSSISSGSWTARFARASAARSSRRQQNGNRRSGKSSPGFSWRNRSGRSILHRWMVFTRWLLPMQTDCVRLRSPGQRPLGVFRWLSHALLHGRSTGRPGDPGCTSTYSPGDARIFGCAARRPCGRLGRSIGNPKRRPGRALDHRPRRLRCGWPRQVHPLPGNGRTYHGAVPVCLQITAVPNSMHRFNLRMDGSRGWYIRRRRHREHILSARSPCRSRPGRSL